MKAIATVLVPLVVAVVIAGCGSSSENTSSTPSSTSSSTASPPAASGGSGPEISAKSVGSLGTVLVDPEGKTLYVFAPDKQKEVTCTGSCAAAWPPVKVKQGEAAVAGSGVKANLLGAAPDPEGGEVVTYAGWPLYGYVADTKPGMATGQAIDVNGGYWYVITPAGKVIK